MAASKPTSWLFEELNFLVQLSQNLETLDEGLGCIPLVTPA